MSSASLVSVEHLKSHLAFKSHHHYCLKKHTQLLQETQPQFYSTTATIITMASKTSFLDAMSTRRSIYALEASSPVPDSRIIEIVNHTILHCPSPFNVQSARAIVLIGEEHKKLWDIAYEAAQDIFSAAAFEGLKLRILGFRGGYGTVMWFEDEGRFNVLEQQMGPERWAGVKDKMPQWSEHSSGMHQYAVWTALEAEGLGCNLQVRS